jgi:hypothetical protein
MVNGEQQGPFTAKEIINKGFSNDSYIFNKGLGDWKKISEVAGFSSFEKKEVSQTISKPPSTQKPKQRFEELYNNNQIDLDEISQIREFRGSVDTNAKKEIIKIWENNLNLKNQAVTNDIENSLDIRQSPENKSIPDNDDVPFSFKKWPIILLGVLGRWILIIIIPFIFVFVNFLALGNPAGAITGFGGMISLNFIIFGFANRNIASNSNRNTTNAFGLGFFGPLGLIICLFNSVKFVQKKILLGILRFLIFAIAMQLLGELEIISNAGKGLLLYFFGFTFILRGVNMFNYSVKKIDTKI